MQNRLLLADDDPTIRLILKSQVAEWGYDVIEADNGDAAWEILSGENPPNIALLDWMMPGCDGFDLCQRYKHEGQSLPFVYIILLTSKSEKQDMVAGLDAGADDYLTKPVASEELRSRLNVARRMVAYESKLKTYAVDMERLARERAAQLVHSDRLSTIGTLAASIIHEINNPVGYISANAQMLEKYWQRLEPMVQAGKQVSTEQDPRLEMAIEDMPRLGKSIYDGAMRIDEIVGNLKRFVRKEPDKGMVECPINDAIGNALAICRPRVKHGMHIDSNLLEPSPSVLARSQQIEQVLVNLIVNADEAMDGSHSKQLSICTKVQEGRVLIVLENNGPHIPQETLKKIWDSFYTTKSSGTGLGLAISTKILEEHKGKIHAENLDPSGVRFTIDLPLA